MIILIFLVYMITITIMLLIFRFLRYNGKPIPVEQIKVKKYGFQFNSNKRHKLNVGDVKLIQLQNCVYLKKGSKTIILKNVDRVAYKKGVVYFTALGNVQILFNCKLFYKYFNILIKSDKFDIKPMQKQALNDILDNIFNINNSIKAKRYIYILKNILKVDIGKQEILVHPNKYNITFSLTYKTNNQIKKVNVN